MIEILISGIFVLLAGILGVLIWMAISLGKIGSLVKHRDIERHEEKIKSVEELERHCPLLKKGG